MIPRKEYQFVGQPVIWGLAGQRGTILECDRYPWGSRLTRVHMDSESMGRMTSYLNYMGKHWWFA